MKMNNLVHRGRLWLDAADVAALLEKAGHLGAAAQIHDLIIRKEGPENERRMAYELYQARKQAEYEAEHPHVCTMSRRWRPTAECGRRFKTVAGLRQHQQRSKRLHVIPEEQGRLA